jgi:hypothetical protein
MQRYTASCKNLGSHNSVSEDSGLLECCPKIQHDIIQNLKHQMLLRNLSMFVCLKIIIKELFQVTVRHSEVCL